MQKQFASLALVFLFSQAASAADPSLLKLPPPSEALPYELIVVRPQKAHHFNLEAPSICSSGEFYEKTKEAIRCQMPASGRHKLEVYVCDDANTFCRKEAFEIAVKGKKSEGKILPLRHTPLNTPQIPGFLTNLDKAVAAAKREKKLLLMNYSSDNCPPCEEMQAKVFPRKDFQEGTKDFVKVYVDARDDRFAEQIRHLKPYSTPTFFVLTPELGEVTRFSGYYPAGVFLAKVTRAKNEASELIQPALVRWKALEAAGRADAPEHAALRERAGLYYAASRDYGNAEKALKGMKSKEARLAYLDARVENAKGDAEPLRDALTEMMEDKETRLDSAAWVAYYIKYYLAEKDPNGARKLAQKALPALREAMAAYDPEKSNTAPKSILETQTLLLDLLERKDEAAKVKSERAELAEKTMASGSTEVVRFRATMERANTLHDDGKPEAGAKIVEEMLAKHPKDSAALAAAAAFYGKQKNFAKARENAKKSADYASGYNVFEAKVEEAWYALKLGEKAAAIAAAREVLAKFQPPKSPAVWSHWYSRRARDLIAMAEGRLPLPEEN